MEGMMIVIPSLNPDNRFIQLLTRIRQELSTIPILVINDGSNDEFDEFFNIAKSYSEIVLKHDTNLGKGAALKTAMSYILDNYPHIEYMITVDADGQHQVSDIRACIEATDRKSQGLVLGTRDFDKDIPLRSKFGNILTRNILKLTTGIHIDDTQTGLRVIPRSFMFDLLAVKGDRYEFETNMLIAAKKFNVPIIMQPIETIYIDDNSSSHFNVISDSIKIYSVFFKYLLVSILSFLIDIVSYAFIIQILMNINFGAISVASLSARVVSSSFNYLMNRNHVFKSGSSNSVLRYFMLVICQAALSSLLVYLLTLLFRSGETVIIKILVDSLLFFISFFVQKSFVFRE